MDRSTWELRVFGAVEHPFTLSWNELLALPRHETVCDIHCVTRWSRYDNIFEGIQLSPILERAGVRPANLRALRHNGEDLTPEHGGPARLVVPHLYFWKSAKWVRGFEFLEEDAPGFWEQNGYHMRGDPWVEARYGRADHARMRRGPQR